MNDYLYYLCAACLKVALISRVELFECPSCHCDLTKVDDLEGMTESLESEKLQMTVWSSAPRSPLYLSFESLTRKMLELGNPDRIYVSRMHEPLAALTNMHPNKGQRRGCYILNATVIIRHEVPENEVWFGFGDTKRLGVKLIIEEKAVANS